MSAPGSLVSTNHTITTPQGFDFWRTVRSHGWYDLLPFSVDLEARRLERVLHLSSGVVALCTLEQQSAGLRCRVQTRQPLALHQRREAIATVRSCFRLDEDFTGFHAVTRRHPRYRWIGTAGAGRMLRSPTVFEDIVKMICTTNCSWALTTIMVKNLVQQYGEEWDNHRCSFPVAAALAGATEKDLRKDIRAGYRAPYLLSLAEEVASGKRDVESWRKSTLPTEELFSALQHIRGVGPYAAGNLLKLLGRYDYLGLDSWVRGQYAAMYARGRTVKDTTIERRYRQYGKWRGLFFWLEMTRYWHDKEFSESATGRDAWTEG
jgi:3-methyladenine DNA glycosylase/8-oxoguanine DNA glycosylase